MQLNIDAAIVVGFLLLNLIVGLWYGRGVKTIKDYALGGRNFSTAALVATIVATVFSGSGFSIDLANTYSKGLSYMIGTLAWCLQFSVIQIFLVPRMSEFMGVLSVAEIMGNLYDSKVRMITAVCGILLNIAFLAVEFKVFGSLVNHFLDISPTYGIIIAGFIVVVYSAFGGIRAITYTDMLQFFTFGFVIPMIGLIIWNKFQSLNFSLNAALANPIFDYQKLLKLKGEELYSLIFLIIYFAIPTVGPIHVQRISMGRNIRQVQTAYMISVILFLTISLAVAWIPFLISTIEPGLEADSLLSHIINNYTYPGFKGLLIIGVIALAMSSADSFINSAAVLFAHDLKEAFNIKRIDNLIASKLFSLVIGGFAICVALYTNNDLFAMIKNASSLYMPIVTVPLIFSILGFRSSAKSVLYGMIAGFIVVIILMLLQAEEVILPAMLTNILFLFGSHYFLKQQGGWVGIKDYGYINRLRQTRRYNISQYVNSIKSSNFIEFCKKTAPKNEMMYTWLGIYLILFTISTMYSTQTALKGINGNMILVIYQIMMCTGVITAMYPIWPPRIKHEVIMQVAWNVIIFYMLVFFSCFFVMLSDFGLLQFAIFTMNIIIAALLVGWKLSLIMIPLGFYLSTMLYKYYTGLDSLNISVGSPEFIFMYTLMLIGSSLIIFLKPKEEQYILAEAKNEHLTNRIAGSEREAQEALATKGEFIKNITHEYNTPVASITSLAQSLWQYYDKLSDNERKEITSIIFKSAKRLGSLEDNLSNLYKLKANDYRLHIEEINLSNLLYDRIVTCRSFYDDNKNDNIEDRMFDINIEENIIIQGDEYYLSQAIDNLIINAITYCKQGKITTTLKKEREKEGNKIFLSIEDEGIGIPPEELYDIFAEFTVSSRTKTPAGGRGVGLALCKKVVEVHDGRIWAESDGVKGAKFVVSLPKF